jgi:predicted nucleotidyltransferase
VKGGPHRSWTTREDKPVDLQGLTSILAGIESVEFAMVFGSARDGMVHAGSDLDVAVWLAEAQAHSIDRVLEIAGRVEDASSVPCDLTVLNAAGPVLRHEALKGRILFVRTGREYEFSEFYVRTCAEYEDLMAWRTRRLAYRGYSCPSTAS